MISKTNALVALVPTADHSAHEGYFVKLASGLAAFVTAATDAVYGVITTGEPTTGQDSIACSWGGFAGIVHVKLAASPGTVSQGTLLELTANGSVKASTGTAGTVLVAQAQESGLANELIEAVLIRPVSVPSTIDDSAVTTVKLAGSSVTGAKLSTTFKTLFGATGADASGGAEELSAVGVTDTMRIVSVIDLTDGIPLDPTIFTAGTDVISQASGNYAADKLIFEVIPASA